MAAEQIFWNKGLAYDTRSVLQEVGYLQTATNISFAEEGKQELRPKFAKWESNELMASVVHSIHAVPGGTRCLLAEGTSLRRKP